MKESIGIIFIKVQPLEILCRNQPRKKIHGTWHFNKF